MLLLIVACLITFFILFSFGDLFTRLYALFAKQDEKYSFIELFLLGMVCVTLILSVTSLWLPSNHIIFFILFVSVVVYWILNKNRIIGLYQESKNCFSVFTKVHYPVMFLLSFLFLMSPLCGLSHIDPHLYYIPGVVWNELYPVVPGLANIEERLGNNSTIFLLSAVFTFRFLSGNPVFILHVLIAILISFWLFKEMVLSKYEIKRVLLFTLFCVFIWLYYYTFASVSTDTPVNLIIFYLIAKALLYPDRQKNKYLLYLLVAVYVVTIKLSAGVFSLFICFYFACRLIRAGKKKALLFIFSTGFLLIAFWCVRNVIISGYLLYPLYFIDLFTVDWKLPPEVLSGEQSYIRENAHLFYTVVLERFWNTVLNFPHLTMPLKLILDLLLQLLAYLSIILVAVKLFSKNRREKFGDFRIWLFITLVCSVLFWQVTGPLIRFAVGILLVQIFAAVVLLFPKENTYQLRNKGLPAVLAIIVFSVILSYPVKDTFGRMCRNMPEVILKPLTINEKSDNQKKLTYFEPVMLNEGVTIYVSHHEMGLIFDVIPAVSSLMPGEHENRFQDYRCIKARGNRIEDGFWYADTAE